MLAESPSVGYIDEPFNLNHPLGICGARFDHWFTYISDDNESTYYKQIKATVGFSYDLIAQAKTIRSGRDARRALREYRTFATHRTAGVRPLIKDPIAVFSAEWLASTFNMDVLVLIRHPAAFAGSLKRMDWTHPFSHFLAQPALMRDHLQPFEAEIREYADHEHGIVDQAALLWRLIHHMILKYQNNHDHWVFLRHEDLSRDPEKGFEDLFRTFNLDMPERARRAIAEYSDASNPSEAVQRADSLRRNSRANIWNWKRRLTPSEIERIREQVEDISKHFYSDDDW